MKSLIVLAIFAASAVNAQTLKSGAQAGERAAKVIRGGGAAVEAGVVAKSILDSSKAWQNAVNASRPSAAEVANFKAQISATPGITGKATDILTSGRELDVVDDGCFKANLTGPAENNLAEVIAPAVRIYADAHSTVDADAAVLKHPDVNGDGKLDAFEISNRDMASARMDLAAGSMINAYGTVFAAKKISKQAAVEALTKLGQDCGLNNKEIGHMATATGVTLH